MDEAKQRFSWSCEQYPGSWQLYQRRARVFENKSEVKVEMESRGLLPLRAAPHESFGA